MARSPCSYGHCSCGYGFMFIFASIMGRPLALLVAVLGLCPSWPACWSWPVAARKAALCAWRRWRGTRRLYWRSVALALPLALLLMLIDLSANIASAAPDHPELTIALALQIGIGLTIGILHLYLLPLLACSTPRSSRR